MENPPAPAENSCAGGFSYLISNVATVIKRDRDLAILVDRQRFHTIDMPVRNDRIMVLSTLLESSLRWFLLA